MKRCREATLAEWVSSLNQEDIHEKGVAEQLASNGSLVGATSLQVETSPNKWLKPPTKLYWLIMKPTRRDNDRP